jgi:hypothetical protein
MSREDNDTVSAPVPARWLGVSGKAVYELAKAAVVRTGVGLYRLEESVTRYCEQIGQATAGRGAPPSSPTWHFRSRAIRADAKMR